MQKTASWCFDIVPGNIHGNSTSEGVGVSDEVTGDAEATSGKTVVTSCFTKAYGRFVRGTGSVILVPSITTSSSPAVPIIKENVGSTSGSDALLPIAANVISSGSGNHAPSHKKMKSSSTDVSVYSTEAAEGRIFNGKWQVLLGISGRLDHDSSSSASAAGVSTIFSEGAGHADAGPPLVGTTTVVTQENNTLRYFAPSELLGLFGFRPPANKEAVASASTAEESLTSQVKEYTFPPLVSNRQCYELIGNSVNVTVIYHLLVSLLDAST